MYMRATWAAWNTPVSWLCFTHPTLACQRLTGVVPLHTLSRLRQLPKAESRQPLADAWPFWHNRMIVLHVIVHVLHVLHVNVHVLHVNVHILIATFINPFWCAEVHIQVTEEIISPRSLIVHTDGWHCRIEEHLARICTAHER